MKRVEEEEEPVIEQHFFSLLFWTAEFALWVDYQAREEASASVHWAVRATCSGGDGDLLIPSLPCCLEERAHCMPWHPWGHMLLWTALLFRVSAGARQGQWRTMGRWDSPESAAATWVGAELGQG